MEEALAGFAELRILLPSIKCRTGAGLEVPPATGFARVVGPGVVCCWSQFRNLVEASPGKKLELRGRRHRTPCLDPIRTLRVGPASNLLRHVPRRAGDGLGSRRTAGAYQSGRLCVGRLGETESRG